MNHPNITAPILAAHPDTQAIYLYGTWGTEYQRPDSDLDIAVLLPNTAERRIDFWDWCRLSVASAARDDFGIPQPGENWQEFVSEFMVPLITSDTAIYQELKNDIFGNDTMKIVEVTV